MTGAARIPSERHPRFTARHAFSATDATGLSSEGLASSEPTFRYPSSFPRFTEEPRVKEREIKRGIEKVIARNVAGTRDASEAARSISAGWIAWRESLTSSTKSVLNCGLAASFSSDRP